MSKCSVVITLKDENETQIILDTVEDDEVNASSTVTRHPIVTGDLVADHMYRNPVVYTIKGKFSKNSSSDIVVLNNNKIDEIQNLFEKIKDDGTLCDIVRVKVDSIDNGSLTPLFKVRKNMVLKNLNWTQSINSVDFSLTFEETLILSIDIKPSTSADLNDPDIGDFVQSNFTDSIFKQEQIDAMIISILLSENVMTEEFLNSYMSDLNKIYSSATVGIGLATGVMLAINPIAGAVFGITALAGVGLASLFTKFKAENRYGIKVFQYYNNQEKNEREKRRFENFMRDARKQFKDLNKYCQVYQVSKDGQQSVSVFINNNAYIFNFVKNNTTNKYSLEIYDVDNKCIGKKDDLTTSPTSIEGLQNNTNKPIFQTGEQSVYTFCDKTSEADKVILTNYYVLISSVNWKELIDSLEEGFRQWLLSQ